MLLFRVSFTGELGFEVNVPADYGAAVWEAIHAAGQAHGMVEYGTEAMHVLRAEKGYIIVGQDTDGTVTPDDAGLSWAIGKNKADFVGKRSLERASMKAADRKQLVGLQTARRRARVLEEGAQVAAKAGAEPAHGIDRSRHLLLCQQRCWAIRSRSRSSPAAARGWDRRCTCPCPAAISRSKSPHRSFTIPPERASMAELAMRRIPVVAATGWLKALPPSARWVLHGDARARALAAPVWGVGFAEPPAARSPRERARPCGWVPMNTCYWIRPPAGLETWWPAHSSAPWPVPRMRWSISATGNLHWK